MHYRSISLPAGAAKVSHKHSDAVAYTFSRAGSISAVGYRGTAAKPAWHYRFKSEKAREAHVTSFFAAELARATHKAARRVEQLSTPLPEVGTILKASWGYDQTNIDFYQVQAASGRMLTLVPLPSIDVTRDGTPYMQGQVTPGTARADAKPFRARWIANSCKVSSCSYASIWNGLPARFSTYA